MTSAREKIQKEIAYYQSIIEKLPHSSPFCINAHLKLGKLYQELEQKEEALQEYVNAALKYTESGEVVKALAVKQKISELSAEDPPASALSGTAYFHHEETLEQGTAAPPPGVRMSQEQKPEVAVSSQTSPLDTPELDGEDAEIASHLRRNILFKELSWAERQWLEENVIVYHFGRDRSILQGEHEQDSLFVILEGYVKIVFEDDEERTCVLAILGAGDFFGEVSLLTKEQTGAYAVAGSAGSVLEIPKTVIATLIKKHPSIVETLKDVSFHRILDSTLANVALFRHLNNAERQKIADFLAPLTIEKGTQIITEGDFGDCMYLIKSGEVGVYTKLMMEEGTENFAELEQQQLHLATLMEGDFFGEQALMTNERRNATVIALSDLQLLRFSKPDLEVIIKNYPRVSELLRRYHHQRSSDTMESLHQAFQGLMNVKSSETPGA
ncbi:MAG: cyclic nucleotide-binding domain-containing protein [bacterium]|nr:cyclic nucleotide-binding domain-containing protein [bacterium]